MVSLTQPIALFLLGATEDPSYDDKGDHPTPDNMWSFGIKCDMVCGIYSVVASILYLAHIGIMAGPLAFWARGNLMLLSSTVMTGVQFLNSVALVFGPDWYWIKVDIAIRRAIFIVALIQFVTWITSFLAEAIKTSGGFTPLETNQEIIFWYLIVINIPMALLSLGTIVIASVKGELSGHGHG